MDFKLVQNLRKLNEDIFSPISAEEKEVRQQEKLDQKLNLWKSKVGSPNLAQQVRVYVRGEIYDRYHEDDRDYSLSKTYSGPLGEVLIEILEEHSYGADALDIEASSALEVVNSFKQNLKGANGDGCDYITKVVITSPYRKTLFTEEPVEE